MDILFLISVHLSYAVIFPLSKQVWLVANPKEFFVTSLAKFCKLTFFAEFWWSHPTLVLGDVAWHPELFSSSPEPRVYVRYCLQFASIVFCKLFTFPSFSLTPLLQMGSNLDYQGGRVTSTDFIPPHFWACSKPGPGFPLVYVIFFSPKLAAWIIKVLIFCVDQKSKIPTSGQN